MAIAGIRLMVMTGCRRQEILSLKKEYIDFEGPKLRLLDSKTGAKEVPLGTGALELLEHLCGLSSSHYVLPSHQDDKHFVGVPKIWAAIRKAIGMEEVRLHDLRHTFASVAATSGESLLMIKAILGHKDQATTQRYAHLQDDPVKAVADRTSATIAAAMLGKPNSKTPN
jgi:integrase